MSGYGVACVILEAWSFASGHTPAPHSKVAKDETLTEADVTALNDGLSVPGVATDNKVAKPEKLTATGYDALLEAAAKRIAVNKYDMLQQMIKMGMVRLVVGDGVIEIRLNFRVHESDYFNSHPSDMSRNEFNFRAKAKNGGLLSLWAKAASSTAYTSLQASTASSSSSLSTSVDVQIMGGVRINFHTDYQLLNQT